MTSTSLRLPLIAWAAVLAHAVFAQTPAAPTEIPNAVQPQVVVGSDGRVWLVYARTSEAAIDHTAHTATHQQHGAAQPQHGEPPRDQKKRGYQPQGRPGDVFVASSTDGGITFAAALKVAHVPKLMLGMRRGPRIAAHGNRITVTVIADEMLAFTSLDGGTTWKEPVTINDVPTSAREGLHDLAGGPGGRLFATWLDLRNGKMELWGASSEDGGRTWGKNEQIYRSPDQSICECCHPTALFDEAGNLAVMWRNAINGARDMWLATRPNGATRFNAARKLGEGTWKLNACPMDGGRIVALGNGNFGAVWQRAGEIFRVGAEGPEISLGPGKQPVAAQLNQTSSLVIWQRGTELMIRRGRDDSAPVKHASDARFPSLAALPGGEGAVLAYERPSLQGGTAVIVERL